MQRPGNAGGFRCRNLLLALLSASCMVLFFTTVTMEKPLTASGRRVLLTEQPPPEALLPKAALMFITRGPMPTARVWREWFGHAGLVEPMPGSSIDAFLPRVPSPTSSAGAGGGGGGGGHASHGGPSSDDGEEDAAHADYWAQHAETHGVPLPEELKPAGGAGGGDGERLNLADFLPEKWPPQERR